jgi:mevalonate kinase
MDRARSIVTVPGKMIISGEHAVLQGSAWFAIPLLSHTLTCSVEGVCAKQWRIHGLDNDLANHWLAIILQYYAHWQPMHLTYTINSTLPMGIGMGSSAALCVALWRTLWALQEHQDYPLSWLQRDGRLLENHMHGQSSGLDIAVIAHEAPIWFDGHHTHCVAWPPVKLQHAYCLPKSPRCTADCIHYAKTMFAKHPTLARTMHDTTCCLYEALYQTDYVTMKACIRQNHRQLCQLGMVSDVTQQWVQAVEHAGGSAKLSGAGSLSSWPGLLLYTF